MMFMIQQALQNYSPTIRIGITEDCRRNSPGSASPLLMKIQAYGGVLL